MQVRDLSNRTGFNVHLDQAFHSEKGWSVRSGAEQGGADLSLAGLKSQVQGSEHGRSKQTSEECRALCREPSVVQLSAVKAETAGEGEGLTNCPCTFAYSSRYAYSVQTW